MQAGAITASHESTTAQPRLVKAAHEFEAQMMKELLKSTIEGDAAFGDVSDTGSGGIYGEFAAEALGQAMSEHGGLGIANSIVRSLSRAGNASRFEPAAMHSVERTQSSRPATKVSTASGR